MTIGVSEFWDHLLKEFHAVIFDKLKIPKDVFREVGLSAFDVAVYSPSPLNPGGEEAELRDALDKFERLCESVPNISMDAIYSLSLGYALMSNIFDDRFEYCGDESAMRQLVSIAILLGKAVNSLYEVNNATDIKRKQALSSAGTLGAEARNRKYEDLKTWALEKAASMREDHKAISRKLAIQVPPHLASVSKDPARLIYDALRTSKQRFDTPSQPSVTAGQLGVTGSQAAA